MLAATAYAQSAIKAGTVQLGGGVGYSQQTRDIPQSIFNGSSYVNTTQHTSLKSFFISPMAGYFVADNLAVGIGLGYNSDKTVYSYDTNYLTGSEQRTRQCNIGAFAQYYQMLTEQFGLTGTLNAGYNHSKQEFISTNSASNRIGSGFSAAIMPSVVFFPIPKFALGTSVDSVRYDYSTSKPTESGTGFVGFIDEASTGSFFGASFGLNYLAFSGTYFLGR
ncbi:MAG: hypothetical protein EOO37_02910 [Cytophagaceae bacterium]|nr:MAG: hypothetical protein EOO37_02910 [Cytophagaceae bacterium]